MHKNSFIKISFSLLCLSLTTSSALAYQDKFLEGLHPWTISADNHLVVSDNERSGAKVQVYKLPDLSNPIISIDGISYTLTTIKGCAGYNGGYIYLGKDYDNKDYGYYDVTNWSQLDKAKIITDGSETKTDQWGDCKLVGKNPFYQLNFKISENLQKEGMKSLNSNNNNLFFREHGLAYYLVDDLSDNTGKLIKKSKLRVYESASSLDSYKEVEIDYPEFMNGYLYGYVKDNPNKKRSDDGVVSYYDNFNKVYGIYHANNALNDKNYSIEVIEVKPDTLESKKYSLPFFIDQNSANELFSCENVMAYIVKSGMAEGKCTPNFEIKGSGGKFYLALKYSHFSETENKFVTKHNGVYFLDFNKDKKWAKIFSGNINTNGKDHDSLWVGDKGCSVIFSDNKKGLHYINTCDN